MIWIKQNKFLTGFLAVMLIAVGVLGFLLLFAKGQYETVQADYETKTAELNRLETKVKPYPEAANLQQFDVQKKEHAEAVLALQKSLTAQQLPIDQLAPEQFQDRLREAVTRVAAKANEKGVKLPERFFLGFDQYQGAPPRPEAAAVLGRQLKVSEMLVSQMIDAGIISLNKFTRDPLPEEDGRKKPAEPAGNRPVPPRGRPGGGPEMPAKALVATHPLDVEFTSDQTRMRNILNLIVANKTQFLIPRLVLVKNEKDVAPSRIDPNAVVNNAPPSPDAASGAVADPAMAAAPTPAAAKPRSAEDLKYIFGAEKLEVRMLVDVVDFAEVAAR